MYLFNKYLLHAQYMSDAVLRSEDMARKKRTNVLPTWSLQS